MVAQITIDRLGRLLIPKAIRDELGLVPGTRLQLVTKDDRIVLSPELLEPVIKEKSGLLVVAGDGPRDLPDHRALREERLERMTPG